MGFVFGIKKDVLGRGEKEIGVFLEYLELFYECRVYCDRGVFYLVIGGVLFFS